LPETTTEDRLLGGRLLLRQPAQGYRTAIDPVLLAAAIPARTGENVLDLGAGVGAASLCLAKRVPEVRIVGLELQPELARLGADNARRNGLGLQVEILAGDILRPPPRLAPASFGHVMANPPYARAESADPSPDAARAIATVEGEAKLDDWIRAALNYVQAKGTITFIHRADRLDDLVRALGQHAGAIVIYPIWPDPESKAAKRVIVTARKGSRTPLTLARGLVLHDSSGAYTKAADAILRQGWALDLHAEPRPRADEKS
jgi:tRNA1(Val) A37 N6-methylase TrmN6